MDNNEALISKLSEWGFTGRKLEKIWLTALALKRSGLPDDSIVRHILEEYRYLL